MNDRGFRGNEFQFGTLGSQNVESFENQLRMIEAILFSSAKPLNESFLESQLPSGASLETIILRLKKDYEGRGIELVRSAGGWVFKTANDLAHIFRQKISTKRRLSKAAIETMAIIAYHQPITRSEIEQIRGVSLSRGTLDILLEADWVQPSGRRQIPGRPLLWVTTLEFLQHFGLNSLSDLPGIEELKTSGILDNSNGLASMVLPNLNEENEDIDQENLDDILRTELEVSDNFSSDDANLADINNDTF